VKEFGPSDSLSLALAAQREILKMTAIGKASHVVSAMSVVDILAAIYSSVHFERENVEAVAGRNRLFFPKVTRLLRCAPSSL